jgi:uncharacterized protein YlxW (UPF0749 family)
MKVFPVGTSLAMKVVSLVACGIIILLAVSLVYSEVGRFASNNKLESIARDHKKELNSVKSTKNLEITNLRAKVAAYDIILDSLDTELSNKDKQINEIDENILKLAGDSIGIVNELKRVLSGRS